MNAGSPVGHRVRSFAVFAISTMVLTSLIVSSTAAYASPTTPLLLSLSVVLLSGALVTWAIHPTWSTSHGHAAPRRRPFGPSASSDFAMCSESGHLDGATGVAANVPVRVVPQAATGNGNEKAEAHDDHDSRSSDRDPDGMAGIRRTGMEEIGLHTALDTSGFLGARADDRRLADTDLVLLDIKSSDAAGYRALTGAERLRRSTSRAVSKPSAPAPGSDSCCARAHR